MVVSWTVFFLCSCQIHLAMAPWGATDGRATVPLDPVEDGKFGQQPFFQSKTKPPNSRTTSRRPNILLSYGSTIHVSHATAYEFACTRQQLPAERLYTNDRMHRMRRKVARCVMFNHKNSREWIGELLISIN